MKQPAVPAPLDRLRPRDLEVVRALVAYPALGEPDIASLIGMGLHNLRARAKHAYDILGVENRLHLYAVYHPVLCDEPCCAPHAGIPAELSQRGGIAEEAHNS